MAKNTQDKQTTVQTGRFVKKNGAAKSAAASRLTQTPATADRFSAGIRAVSRRDREGLIKLADR